MVTLSKNNLVALIGITTTAMLGVVAGCSGDDSSGVTNPGGDSGMVGDDGSTGSDGSKTGDGGTGDSGGPTDTKTGFVNFTQNTFAGPIYSNSGTAAFYDLPAGTDLDCTGFSTVSTPTAATSACTIKVCTDPISLDAGPTPDAGASDAGPVTLPNTGDITLKTAIQTSGVVLTANQSGTYTVATSTSQWWAAGDNTAEVKSNGSATSIAAFDDTGLLAPGDVTNPSLGGSNVGGPSVSPIAFDRGTDLAVTYSGGAAGTKLTVNLTTTSSAKKAFVRCDFDASNGSQSIKTADLENLEQANGTSVTGAYTVQDRTVKSTSASGFTFDVVLGANLHSGSFTNSN